MRTIKVMFLLVRIFNNEPAIIPKRIKYNKHIYEYEKEVYDWTYYKDNKVKYLMSDVFNSIDNVSDILNYEVEIVEDETKGQEEVTLEECNEYFKKQYNYMEKIRNYKPNPRYMTPEETEEKITFTSKTYDLNNFAIDYPGAAELLTDIAMKVMNK